MVTHVNNIFGIRINSVSHNASLNFGNTSHRGHQANVKVNAGYYHNGDANLRPLQFNNVNNSHDTDGKDQIQVQI